MAKTYLKGSKWECRCDCGNLVTVASQKIIAGETRSCGCLLRDVLIARNATHGQPKDKAYHAWAHIIQRCTNPKDKSWENYGGRGIKVAREWRSFERFLADMGRPASADLTIDRINNDGDYRPGNCRWATRVEQARNKRDRRRFEHDGKNLTIWEWAEERGISEKLLRGRLENKWPIARALTQRKYGT